ncbi:hypothetical protein [Mahella australiensis]|uniref:Uncharacterized protein n=1 Tax=Mahella australiensis (strain DSM 15567 / CIP 107919 / 50-1 BON) TaxID=697281 RepID=F3ZX62_MAHA5|nr:hypothetical protein [Mahella australiensis]AEE95511.1 hypothetical protein Mahau_0294 [Mahella australiensis 50-1 BON]
MKSFRITMARAIIFIAMFFALCPMMLAHASQPEDIFVAEQFALGSENTDIIKTCLRPAAEMVGSMGLDISQDIDSIKEELALDSSGNAHMIDYTSFGANKGEAVKESFEISSVELGILGPDPILENIVVQMKDTWEIGRPILGYDTYWDFYQSEKELGYDNTASIPYLELWIYLPIDEFIIQAGVVAYNSSTVEELASYIEPAIESVISEMGKYGLLSEEEQVVPQDAEKTDETDETSFDITADDETASEGYFYVGMVPGPDGTDELVVGIVVPGLVSIALTILGGVKPPLTPSPVTGGGQGRSGETIGMDDPEYQIQMEISKRQAELDSLRKQWEESEKTADKSDPGYQKLKSQYDERMKYLEDTIKQNEYKKYQIQVEKAEKQAELEAKKEWAKQRQADYIAVKEEKAFIEAAIKGYGGKGYDTEDMVTRLNQLNEREKELAETLSENDAMIDYTAREREAIGPGAEFDKITKEYQRKKAELEAAKALADKEKRKRIEKEIAQAEAEYKDAMKSAARWDMATKAAEGVQFGADVAIEGLSHVTGPAGEQVKLIYKTSKNIAEGMGEGMADPKNAGKHLAKGLIGAVAEIASDALDENKFQAAFINTAREALQGDIDARIKGKPRTIYYSKGKSIGCITEGEDPEVGFLRGTVRGVIDSVADLGLGKIKKKIPIPKGSSVDVHDYSLKKIYNNNPLTKGLTKTVLREGASDKIKDAAKDGIVNKLGKKVGAVDEDD